MKRNVSLLLCALCLVGCGFATLTTGCQPKAEFEGEQQQAIGRLQSIAQYSGGDWSKVKPEDRKFLIDGPGSGSESSAKMILSSIAKSVQK